MFKGEYSFIGTLLSDGTAPEIFEDMLKNFTRTEVTAFYLDKLKESDVYLYHLKKDINEDVWLNIVNSRQFTPTIDKNVNIKNWEGRIKKDWEVFLPEMGFQENMNFFQNIKTKQTMSNIIRLAQANARGEAREKVTDKDMEEARKIFTNSAEELISHNITKAAKQTVAKQKEQNRIQSIKALLDLGSSSLDDMWQQLQNTGYYSNKRDFEEVIDWLHKKGFIIKLSSGYTWV
jgi:hypothetical protein